ncbi:piggyBac transposable element-derived protein 4-like isoform X1 [Eurosta solidaginis]|uniref:piggyBac transposable element-derived protein 4-like isoform X1 n=1 Tax=Eurosta solidaginis TaxID=178769 RepID=UPI003530E7F4
MVDIIVLYTNKKAEATYAELNAKHPEAEPKTWKKVTLSEMYAFIGVLIMTGANRSNAECAPDLWSVENCALYRASMGINCFQAILRFIRFDDGNTRAQRLVTDKAVPISELWTMMNYNFEQSYKPSEYLTVDEQLFPYRGRTRFTQYIPSKPAKYGIKVWWVCDAKNAYPLHGQIYTGQKPAERETNQGERVVKDLVSRFHGTGRNITMDNFFTSLNLLGSVPSMNLTAVGTLRKNKPYIPKKMLAHKDRAERSSTFDFRLNISICSLCAEKNKEVILLSSMHDDDHIGESGKPEMIEFYNKTKGVDVMDQLLGEYTCQRMTKRWPLSLFFNMIDLTALAAYIIYYENNPNIRCTNAKRKRFLRQLAKELSMPIIEERSVNQQVMRSFNTKIAVASFISTALQRSADNRPSTSAAAGAKPKKTAGWKLFSLLHP